jgi:hypothetical protein
MWPVGVVSPTWASISSAPHYIPGASGQRSASKLKTGIDPRDTLELPVIDLPGDPRRHQMQASPNDHAGHPILHDDERASVAGA